jgi:MFS family permease
MPPPRTLRVALTLGATQTLGWGSTYYLPAILAQPMAADLGVPSSWAFGAFSAALVVSAVLGPAAGRWIDRAGGRGALASSSLIFAAGLVALGAAEGPLAMALGWLILGVGMSCGLYEAAFAALARFYGAEARRPITGVTLIAGFASTVCWPISAFIEAEAGWRAACFFWAGAHLLAGLPLNLSLPRATPAADAPSSPAATAGQPARKRIRIEPRLALMAWAFAATWMVSTAMATHLPALLMIAGAAPAAAIAAAALVGPAQVAARLAEFALLRRAHPLTSSRLACLAHPVGAVALAVFGGPAAAAFALLHGAGNGVMTIAKGTLPLAVFGPADYGARQGWLSAPARFGQAVAPLAFAVLLDVFGVGVLTITAALMLSALGALMLLRLTASDA